MKKYHMKHLVIIVMLALFAIGCSRRSSSSISPATSFGFISNWIQDTLGSGYPADTMFTLKSGDTSYVVYHNTKLYLFYVGSQNDSSPVYINCYLSPNVFDTVNAWTKCTITPYTYFSTSFNAWKSQSTLVIVNQVYPHFTTTSGYYSEL